MSHTWAGEAAASAARAVGSKRLLLSPQPMSLVTRRVGKRAAREGKVAASYGTAPIVTSRSNDSQLHAYCDGFDVRQNEHRQLERTFPIQPRQRRQSQRPLHGLHDYRQSVFQDSQLPLRQRQIQRRHYAVQAPGRPALQVFDRQVKRSQRSRSAADAESSRQVDYVRDEIAMRLCERLLDINRHFPSALDLGANACNIARALTIPAPDLEGDETTITASSAPSTAPPPPSPPPLTTRIGHLTCADSCEELLFRDTDLPFNQEVSMTREHIADEENPPYGPESFDVVLSSLSMHWINDLPGLLSRINTILKPDSPFIGVMLGGDSLFELRTSLQLAELERRGGLAPHVSPLADVRDVGGLLTRAGFKMLTVDVDDLVVEYPDLASLMTDLQAMGESNALLGREQGANALSRDVMMAAEGIYRELHGEDASEPGRLPATFRMIYMIGWKEGSGQPEPLARGSGQANLKDLLERGSSNGDKGNSG